MILDGKNSTENSYVSGLSTCIYLPTFDNSGNYKLIIIGGTSDWKHQLPINQYTKFDVASITKMFTLLLLFKLEEQGIISLDEKVSNLNPDIQGLEDFFGDMDFKVTGTTEGITAIQMDIKIHGLTRPIVEGAIARCREARLFIMDTCMKQAIAEPRQEVGPYAPKIISIQIDPEKIGDVVGQRGKTINEIIGRTGVKIDITDDGQVSVCGTDKEMMDKALEMVKMIVTDFEEGQIFKGKVISIKEFGAFIEFAPGKEGMVHISKITKGRINHVEDVLTLGDIVTVICLGKDKMGRISFSIKDVPKDK